MKTKTAVISSVSAVLCAIFALSACSAKWDFTMLVENTDVHTNAQAEYLQGDYKVSTADGTKELSRPEPVHFTWEADKAQNSDASVKQYIVEISEYVNFKDSVTYAVSSTELDVYNLYIGTEYYWRVTAELDGGKKQTSKTSSFTTSDAAPRNIYADGVTNMRDLGGWETADGGKVKQGMIYRCGRLNESETNGTVNVEITQKGIATMRDELHIKSQIDLRTPNNHNVETGGLTSSPLGEDVIYKNFAMEWDVGSKNILTYEQNVPQIKAVFEYLADESNYPIIYHCNIGTDRTGLFAFLINGLLGVAEDDLYRDYLFSNFGYICYKPTDSPRTYEKLTSAGGYVDIIKKYHGDTLSEKIENYLIEKIGVSQSDIQTIKNLLTA